jgi:hypothetical protein
MFVSKPSRQSPQGDLKITSGDQARLLRDAAMSVLKAGGKLKVDTDDGLCSWTYEGPELRINYQPAVAGASMPRIVEVWETATAGSMI